MNTKTKLKRENIKNLDLTLTLTLKSGTPTKSDYIDLNYVPNMVVCASSA